MFEWSGWGRRSGLCLAALLIALVPGCGKKEIQLYPASGKLLMGGKPAAGVFVTFVPVEAGQDDQITRSFATTGEDGSFTLSTWQPGDGAPAGDYRVTLLYEPLTSQGLGGRLNNKKNPIRIDPKYARPETTPLRGHIDPGPSNVIPPFEVP